jgi:uncharacterized protein
MIKISEFTPPIIEHLGYYVYLLIDPESNAVFYVGKGTGNRIFAHVNQAIESPEVSDKLEKIREIQSKGLEIKYLIQRHGLTEKEAFEVEASLIDYIGLTELVNIVDGQKSRLRGKMTIPEIIALYDAEKIEIKEPSILITINRLYRRGMSQDELYEITRGNWVVGVRREKVRYAFSVYNGIVRQVYSIQRWNPALAGDPEQKTRKRWRFEGSITNELQHYVGGSVGNYITLGAQNPIKYVNC